MTGRDTGSQHVTTAEMNHSRVRYQWLHKFHGKETVWVNWLDTTPLINLSSLYATTGRVYSRFYLHVKLLDPARIRCRWQLITSSQFAFYYIYQTAQLDKDCVDPSSLSVDYRDTAPASHDHITSSRRPFSRLLFVFLRPDFSAIRRRSGL